MLTNFWSRVRIFCGNHEDSTTIMMIPHSPASGNVSASLYGNQTNMFYACPKYYPENRSEDEKPCRNHISLKEFEGVVNHLAELIDDGVVDIVGERWKSKQGVEYCVIRQDDTYFDVLCLNRKGLWNK